MEAPRNFLTTPFTLAINATSTLFTGTIVPEKRRRSGDFIALLHGYKMAHMCGHNVNISMICRNNFWLTVCDTPTLPSGTGLKSKHTHIRRHAGEIVVQGRPTREKSTDLQGHLYRTLHNVGTSLGHFRLEPLARPVFHTVLQIAPSSYHELLFYIAYLISDASYQCPNRLYSISLTFAPPAPPN